MRQHYLGRVRNTYGTVQEDIDVSIYLAGTVSAAIVYTVASGGVAITVAPQIQSDSDGLIDFYLDESYGSSQLFDIKIGDKTYENVSILLGDGDMKKSVYDTDSNNIVDSAESVNGGVW